MAKVSIKLVKSLIRSSQRQIDTVNGLGLFKIGDVVVVEKTKPVMGMVSKVNHLISLSEEKKA